MWSPIYVLPESVLRASRTPPQPFTASGGEVLTRPRRAAELALQTPAELLPTILADVEEYYEHWQDQHLTDSRSWLEDGSVTIEKRRDLDLAASAWAASADCSDASRHIPR